MTPALLSGGVDPLVGMVLFRRYYLATVILQISEERQRYV